jgi:hypothetical protein
MIKRTDCDDRSLLLCVMLFPTRHLTMSQMERVLRRRPRRLRARMYGNRHAAKLADESASGGRRCTSFVPMS